jgi:hypothetical protein
MASTLAGTALRQFLHRLACGPSGELSDGEGMKKGTFQGASSFR